MRYLLIIFLSMILTRGLLAEVVTVEMLNKLEKRSMVFSQEIVKINSGDTEVDPEQGLSAPRSTECSIVRPAEQTFGTHEPPAKFPSTPQACWPFAL